MVAVAVVVTVIVVAVAVVAVVAVVPAKLGYQMTEMTSCSIIFYSNSFGNSRLQHRRSN